ncbi:MAG: hypothetical protein ACRD16_10135 [Thermoanaerobaculia bacterium]
MNASATLGPTKVAVGDPIQIRLTLDCAPSSTVTVVSPAPSDSLERLAVTPWNFRREGGRWRVERLERWASFAPGTSARLHYRIRTSSEGAADLASPSFETVSVLPPGRPPAISPLAGPLERTSVPWEWAAAAALALLVALLFARLLRRRHDMQYSPKSPDELFEQELALLEEKLSRGEPDGEFFDWLAETTRWYLEQKLRFPAPRETTFEIAAELDRFPKPMPARDIAVVLAACDGYRFARRETRHEQAAESLAAARRAAADIRAATESSPQEVSA